MEINSTCEPCQCSGNIDVNDPEACDFLTGACLVCSNHTTGPQCERCENWWYGDAVVAKDCYRKLLIIVVCFLGRNISANSLNQIMFIWSLLYTYKMI